MVGFYHLKQQILIFLIVIVVGIIKRFAPTKHIFLALNQSINIAAVAINQKADHHENRWAKSKWRF